MNANIPRCCKSMWSPKECESVCETQPSFPLIHQLWITVCLSVCLCSLFPSLVLVWSYYHINVLLFVFKEQWFDSLQITAVDSKPWHYCSLYTQTAENKPNNMCLLWLHSHFKAIISEFLKGEFLKFLLSPPNVLLFKGVAR